MTKKDTQTQTLPDNFTADEMNEPIGISELLAQTGALSEMVKAELLKDETFFIIAMNPFESRFEGQGHAYHCICKETLDGDYFRTVLGGTAIVRHLDAICEMGLTNPIRVTLKFIDGGKYGGYYTLE